MTLLKVAFVAIWLIASVAASTSVEPVGATGQAASPRQSLPLERTGSTSGEARALLNKYCVSCHHQGAQAGSMTLDSMDVTRVGDNAETWERVVRKLRGRLMPPPNRPRPDSAAHDGFLVWLETELDRSAAASPNPGRTEPFHRLNRAEYGNAVRDLLHVDVDVSSLLPADDASYGFDNMAGALKLSQSLVERYLSAARKVSRSAVGIAPPAPLLHTVTVSPELPQYDQLEGLPFGTRGGVVLNYQFPRDGEYIITVEPQCDKTTATAGCDGTDGFSDSHILEVTVDGERLKTFTLDAKETRGGYRQTDNTLEELRNRFQVRTLVKAGPRQVGATFVKLPSIEEFDAPRARFETPYYQNYMVPKYAAIYQPYIGRLTINGPYTPTGAGDTPSRREIFACHPTTATADACAKRILGRLTRKAFRRPITDTDLGPLMAVYRDGNGTDGFETGIQQAIEALLVRPEFLFRVEHEDAPIAGANYRVSDVDLASRLSFFLWSSLPDDELLDLASRRALNQPGVLEKQVARMLADPRSGALTENFAGQWLQLRNLQHVRPSEPLFPNFDASLRQAFRRETELFFDSIVRENRSLLELLTADYTFVNERLARHYGIPYVSGTQFRRVELPPGRRGLLGQGSILTVTSQPTRTSPVFRGKWILDNLLGTRPPDPPAEVPKLEEASPSAQARSVREQMAEHRKNPTCASCHAMIDPLGFALEHYDAVGRWRDLDGHAKVDASGTMPDGTPFDGAEQFVRVLVQRPEGFAGTVTEKLLTYALGRGVEYYDMPAVRKIVRDSAPSNYQFSNIVTGIVRSLPFQMRRSLS